MTQLCVWCIVLEGKVTLHCEIVQYDHMLLLIAKVVFVTIISKCIKFYIAGHKGKPLMEESELFLTLTICYICNMILNFYAKTKH